MRVMKSWETLPPLAELGYANKQIRLKRMSVIIDYLACCTSRFWSQDTGFIEHVL